MCSVKFYSWGTLYFLQCHFLFVTDSIYINTADFCVISYVGNVTFNSSS